MLKIVIAWGIAIVVTLSAAVYQRLTGPTYPLRGSATVGDSTFDYRLPRSHGGEGGPEVSLDLPRFEGSAALVFRRYKTGEGWTRLPMSHREGRVTATLPHQPPAGKLEYYVELTTDTETSRLPSRRSAVIRFKGDVPAAFLLPHILLMFVAMMLSNRAGVEAVTVGPRLGVYASLAAACLLLGGMVLGPVVQKYAFGAFWTGWPFGYDLTDNKTLLAMAGWALALWQTRRRAPSARWWVLGAALLLLLIYSIPHSALGSELDYATGEVITGD